MEGRNKPFREDMVVGDDSSSSGGNNNNNNNIPETTTPNTIFNDDYDDEDVDNYNEGQDILVKDDEIRPLLYNNNNNNSQSTSSMLSLSQPPFISSYPTSSPSSSSSTWRTQWFLYFSVCLSVLSTLEFGYNTGVISSTIIFIQTEFNLDTFQKSSLVSIILVGCMIGCMASGSLVDWIGRKNTLVYNNIPYIIGPVLACFGQNYAMLMLGRIITGFAVGIASAVVPTYISELSPPQKRGSLGLLRQSTITFGIMLSSLIAYKLIHIEQGWRYMFIISIGPSIMQLLGCFWFVETPRWLLSKNRTQDAVNVLKKLDTNSTQESINNQIQKINSNIIEQRGSEGWLQLLKLKYLRVYFIGFGLSMFQQFVGINCVNYYSATILQSAGFSKDMAVLISGLVGTPQMVMMFGSIWLIDRFGRKPLLLISDVGMILGLGLLGYSFIGTGVDTHITSGSRAWMAVGGMVFYKLAFAVGMGPIPLMVASEIYPSKIRGKAMSIVALLNWLANFIANITFLPIQDAVGQAASYWVFAGVSFLCLIFTFFWVPETKGLTIEELSKKLVKEDDNNGMTINSHIN